jgi:ATP-dependent helicase HepA
MTATQFRAGQRVFAPAEPHLGLGLVGQESGRRFTVIFPKTQESRTYSQDTEALVRFRASVGDHILDGRGVEHRVHGVLERGETLAYQTGEGILPEAELGHDFGQPDPFAELALGRPGSPADFARRLRAHRLKAFGRGQPHRGLGAARVEMLPHQLYVTERVARMWRPRALLADEVGLGKTVEAGLVAVRMAALGRVGSLAVVAPRPLVGQWLAEFYRRFARPLTLFDPELEDLPQDLLLAADDLEFLPDDFSRDLLIVDEAHHYSDDEVLKVLTRRSRAVLLLSATPSLGGQDRLFGLLHLLDPLRYPDRDSLSEKGHRWREVAELARDAEAGAAIEQVVQRLERLYPEEEDLLALAARADFQELLDRLVDRHGLGRSLLRNRRRRLQGLFPGRRVLAHTLSAGVGHEDFVVDFLKERSRQGEKTLVMVETPADVARWSSVLQKRSTLAVARFDETMSLLERDRQAAWFNRTGQSPIEGEGADVLICSEIGGEGRNFQVAHHLLLLDLPAHPDRLEQRIGRLDRIGQTHLVQVHVPLPDSNPSLAIRFAWLDQGLDAFRRPLTEGQRAWEAFGEELARWEARGHLDDDFQAWCLAVRQAVDRQQAEAEAAIDPLVDRMSFREDEAERLRALAESEQAEIANILEAELVDLLDSLGVVLEPGADSEVFVIKPGEMMFIEALPGMPPDGCAVTFSRSKANVREDVEFLHFEHRLVQSTLDLILDEGVGRATAARWRNAPRTTIAFQFLLLWEADADPRLGIDRFLPAQAVVVTADMAGAVASGSALPAGPGIPEDALERLGPDVVETLLSRTTDLRPRLLEKALAAMEAVTEKLLTEARGRAHAFFDAETARLQHLHHTEESGGEADQLYAEAFSNLKEFRCECEQVLARTEWRFDAVRLILCQEACA